MKTFFFKKLVRDKVLERCIADEKVKTFYWTLSDEEYQTELVAKLHEEIDEAAVAVDAKEMLAEIADVQEVLDALAGLYGFTKADINTAQDSKRQKNGAFNERAYIEKVELDDDSEWVEIFRAQPDKYKEA